MYIYYITYIGSGHHILELVNAYLVDRRFDNVNAYLVARRLDNVDAYLVARRLDNVDAYLVARRLDTSLPIWLTVVLTTFSVRHSYNT